MNRLPWLLLAPAAGAVLLFCAWSARTIWAETSTDSFCSRCHTMHPYFAAHRDGPHGEIACRECHIGEQPLPALGAKLRGSRFLLLHHLGAGSHPQGVVTDRTCRQEACHPRGGGDSLPWHGLMFHHSRHLESGRFRLSEKARCTLCHGRALAAGHGIAVRRESCLLCHLKEGQVPEGTVRDESCLLCHGLTPKLDLGGGAGIDHAHARAEGHRCGDCHGGLHRVGGEVEEGACRTCHGGDPGRYLAQPGFPDRVHHRHGHLLSVNCNQCHGPVRHRAPAPWQPGFPEAGLRCSHAGGRRADGKPRAFVRIDCRFCHVGGQGGELRAGRCTLCHEEKE